MTALPDEFLKRMKAQLGDSFEPFLAAYSNPPKRALRLNGLKTRQTSASREYADAILRLPAALTPASMSPSGFILPPDAPPLGEHPYHRAGLFYLQEPSAMCAAELLAPEPNMKVLDLCAAPGGKTGALAAFMRGSGLIVANEPVKSRASALVSNIERLGVTNAVVTVAMPDALAALLPRFFDAVMVDAPCSGEGMFRKDENARAEWSADAVRACAKRQREILQSAQALTAPGGRLVYSTCTFSQEEDEENARWFVKTYPRFSLVKELKLYPHACDGEGHYAALFRDDAEPHSAACAQHDFAPVKDKRFTEFIEQAFLAAPDMPAYLLRDGRVAFMPFTMPEALTRAYILRAGVLAGSLEKGRFEPEHALFMAAFNNAKWRGAAALGLDDPRLGAFLRGEEIAVSEALGGFAPVTADGYCVGFVKAVKGVGKNKLPKGLRIKNG